MSSASLVTSVANSWSRIILLQRPLSDVLLLSSPDLCVKGLLIRQHSSGAHSSANDYTPQVEYKVQKKIKTKKKFKKYMFFSWYTYICVHIIHNRVKNILQNISPRTADPLRQNYFHLYSTLFKIINFC